MRPVNSLLYALFLGALWGCLGVVNDAKKTVRVHPDFVFATSASDSTTTADTWTGLCTKITIRFVDANADPIPLTDRTTILLSSSLGTTYSGPDCSTTSTTFITAAEGARSAALYYKTTAAGGVDTLVAGYSSTDTISLTISVVTPTADRVLGQADMVSNNNPGVPDQSTFWGVTDVLVHDGKVWVADSFNNRVLIWTSAAPDSSSTPGMILGQLDYTSNGTNVSSTEMGYPSYFAVAGSKFLVADSDNNRIMVWNSTPAVDRDPASFVIGQPDMSTGGANTGGVSGSSLSYPGSVSSDGTHVAVADYSNNRVLIWNSVPSADNSSANVVLGQSDMTSTGSGTTRTTMSSPYFANLEGGKLIVSDYANHRVLIWNSVPSTNGKQPDVVLGQGDFVSGDANRGGLVAANTINRPGTARVDSQGRLFLSDAMNNRILIWNQVPTSNGASADAVIGQSDFESSAADVTATNLNTPWGLRLYGNYLWIVDNGNNRVLRYPVP